MIPELLVIFIVKLFLCHRYTSNQCNIYSIIFLVYVGDVILKWTCMIQFWWQNGIFWGFLNKKIRWHKNRTKQRHIYYMIYVRVSLMPATQIYLNTLCNFWHFCNYISALNKPNAIIIKNYHWQLICVC